MSDDKNKQEQMQNGYDPESLDAIPPVLEIQPTIRARIWEMGIALVVCLFMVYLIKQVPAYGTYLDKMLGFKMNLLHIKLSYELLVWPLRIGALAAFGYMTVVVLQQKSTLYQLNDRNFIFTRGVLVRESDSTDLVSIRDYKLTRTIHDRILGLSRLIIFSKDMTDPEMPVVGIEAREAQQIINFLRKYAFQNYTEWRLAQERNKRRQNAKRPNPLDIGNIVDDDNGDDN